MAATAQIKTAMTRLLPKYVSLRVLAHRARARGDNPELDLLPKYARDGIFVDIGANIGDYSRVACLHYRSVISFEPIPELASKLRNELGSNARVERAALSNTSGGTATLRIPVAAHGETTGLASLESRAIADAACREISVPLRRLDDYRLSCVDMVKIDVEGHEAAVLEGAAETIRRCRPAMIVEIEDRHHPGETRRIFDMLAELGMAPHYYRDGQLMPVAIDGSDSEINMIDGRYVCNFVFLPA